MTPCRVARSGLPVLPYFHALKNAVRPRALRALLDQMSFDASLAVAHLLHLREEKNTHFHSRAHLEMLAGRVAVGVPRAGHWCQARTGLVFARPQFVFGA